MNMYFIALVCPEEINKQVLKWKVLMKEKHGCEAALRSPAHITIIPPYWMNPDSETNLKNSLSNFSNTQHCFTIQLKNCSYFKPKVIFIDVAQNKQLIDLKNDLFKFLLSESSYPIEQEERPFHPHVTIATRDLYKKSFYEAWEYFKEIKYEKGFKAESLSLLRHNKQNWDIIASYRFK